MVLLEFTQDGVTWVVTKLSGNAEALGEEAIEICNWLVRIGYALEELTLVVLKMSY